MTTPPFRQIPQGIGLRQRQKADGSWRVWWEPSTKARKAGASPVELDANRPTWSEREARRLHKNEGKPAARSASGGRTVAALIAEYEASDRFTSRRPATKVDYRKAFRPILDHWGTTHCARITKPQVYDWYVTREKKSPTWAGKLVRILSLLMTHAELLGWRPENSNPCMRLRAKQARKRKRYASWDELDALIDAAEVLGYHSLATGIVLAVFSGQRQLDIIQAAPGDFLAASADQPGADQLIIWSLERSKRQNLGHIPLHPEASARVRTCLPKYPSSRTRLLIDEVTGKGYSSDLFRKRYAEIRAKAEKTTASLRAEPLEFRDLRRTFGVWSRLGGAQREDVGDVLGNAVGTDDALARVYTPAQLATALRAVQAVRRPEDKKERRA